MAKLNVCKYFDINYSWAISITIHFCGWAFTTFGYSPCTFLVDGHLQQLYNPHVWVLTVKNSSPKMAQLDIKYSGVFSITIHFFWMGIYNIWIFPMYISCRWAFKHLDIHMFWYWLSMTRYIGYTMDRFQTLKSHLCDRVTEWQTDRVTWWLLEMLTHLKRVTKSGNKPGLSCAKLG